MPYGSQVLFANLPTKNVMTDLHRAENLFSAQPIQFAGEPRASEPELEIYHISLGPKTDIICFRTLPGQSPF